MPTTAVALRAHGFVLDTSDGYEASLPRHAQAEMDAAALKFVDGDVDFGHEPLQLALLRCLQVNAPKERARWFEEVRECRRRQRVEDIQRTALGRYVLAVPNEYVVDPLLNE